MSALAENIPGSRCGPMPVGWTGSRDSLLTFIGADLVAAQCKQWRFYFTDEQHIGLIDSIDRTVR
jgi:hypothetical protein